MFATEDDLEAKFDFFKRLLRGNLPFYNIRDIYNKN